MKTARDMEHDADADLAAAYAEENEGVRLDYQAFVVAAMFGVIPLAFVLLLLSFWLGDWVWRLLQAIWIALVIVQSLVASGLLRRYRSNLPMDLPGEGRITGTRKKRLVLRTIAAVAVVLVANLVFNIFYGDIREWVLGLIWPL